MLNIDKAAEEVFPEPETAEGRPLERAHSEYHVGDTIEGYVTSITDFGVFVEIEEGIEGLIHLGSEMDEMQRGNILRSFSLSMT